MCYPPLHKLPGVKDCIDSLANSFLMLFIRFETYTRGTYKYKQTNKQTNKHTNKQITIGNQNHTVCHSAREKKKKILMLFGVSVLQYFSTGRPNSSEFETNFGFLYSNNLTEATLSFCINITCREKPLILYMCTLPHEFQWFYE